MNAKRIDDPVPGRARSNWKPFIRKSVAKALEKKRRLGPVRRHLARRASRCCGVNDAPVVPRQGALTDGAALTLLDPHSPPNPA
jgi:hypothetical protein